MTTDRPGNHGFDRSGSLPSHYAAALRTVLRALQVNGVENYALVGDAALALRGGHRRLRTIELVVAPEEADSLQDALHDLNARLRSPGGDDQSLRLLRLFSALGEPAFRVALDLPQPEGTHDRRRPPVVIIAASAERVPSPQIDPANRRADTGMWFDLEPRPMVVGDFVVPVITAEEQAIRDACSVESIRQLSNNPDPGIIERLQRNDLTASDVLAEVSRDRVALASRAAEANSLTPQIFGRSL